MRFFGTLDPDSSDPSAKLPCIRDVLDRPEAGSVLVGAVRRRLIRRFPYAVLYSVKATGIRILAVMNLRRRPMYWGASEGIPAV